MVNKIFPLLIGALYILSACSPNLPPSELQYPPVTVTITSPPVTLPAAIDPTPTASVSDYVLTPTISSTLTPPITDLTPAYQPTEDILEKTSRFGVQMHSFGLPGEPTLMAQMGVGWTRRDLVWKEIEPVPGERNWNAVFEQELASIVNLGIKPIIILEGTPNWALSQGFNCGVVDEEILDELGTFVYDLVQRYSVPPYSIKYWELWNEPDAANFLGCWGDPRDKDYYGGAYYGQMLKIVYPKMKAADPEAQVLVGGLLLDCDPNNPPQGKTCVESRFLRGILENGAGDYFDGVAFHGYDYYFGSGLYANPNWNSSSTTTGPVSLAKAKYLEALLNEYGQGNKYLMSTEVGLFYGSYPQDIRVLCDSNAPPEVQITKAYYVVHTYTAAVAQGWITHIWYSALGIRCSGLITADLTPLPAYYAYQFTSQKLLDAQYVREITEYPQIKVYEFKIPGRYLWVLWSLDGNPHQISVGEEPISITRIGHDGKPIVESGSTLLTIDSLPRFIEFRNE